MSYNDETGGVFNAYGLSLIEPADLSPITHERTLIREFYVARLIAAVVDPERVHVDPLMLHQARPNEWKIPAFNVSMGEESTEIAHAGPVALRCEVDFIVEVIGCELDGVDVERVVDQLELGVRSLIMAELGRPLSIYDVVPVSSSPTFSSEGAMKTGKRQITFRITYYTALPEPLSVQPTD